MTYEEVEKWIDDSLSHGGNDFIAWEELKNKVNEKAYMYITYLIGYYNKDVIFKTDSEKEIAYTKRLLKESL